MMKSVARALAFTFALGGLLVAGPATAMAESVVTTVRTDVAIGGQSWPVTCQLKQGGVQLDCTANSSVKASDKVKRKCFVLGSLPSGPASTCSDYGPLNTYLQSQGSGSGSGEASDFSFDCEPFDLYCEAQEKIANDVASFIVDSLEWVFGNSGLNTSSSLYQSALAQSGFWWTVTSFFTIAAAAVGIAWGAVRGNKDVIIRAVIGLAATFGTTWIAIFGLGYVLNFVDLLTEPILSSGLKNGSIAASVSKLLYPEGVDAAMSVFGNLPATLAVIGLAIGMVVIVFVNSLRDFGLMVLIAFGPLAFALLPVRAGGGWIRNWVSAVVALLLTKPLVLGLLVLILSSAGGIESIYSIQALPLLIGFSMTLFMPFVAFGLFNFIGAAAAPGDQAGVHAGRGLGRAGSVATRAVKGVGGGSPRSAVTSGGSARGGGQRPATPVAAAPSASTSPAPAPAAAPAPAPATPAAAPTKTPAVASGRWQKGSQ